MIVALLGNEVAHEKSIWIEWADKETKYYHNRYINFSVYTKASVYMGKMHAGHLAKTNSRPSRR